MKNLLLKLCLCLALPAFILSGARLVYAQNTRQLDRPRPQKRSVSVPDPDATLPDEADSAAEIADTIADDADKIADDAASIKTPASKKDISEEIPDNAQDTPELADTTKDDADETADDAGETASPADQLQDDADAPPPPPAKPAYKPTTRQIAVSTAVPEDLRGAGFLLVSDADDPLWQNAVRAAAQKLPKNIPLEIVFQCDNVRKIQDGIDNLQFRRLEKLVVIPFFLNSYSEKFNRLQYRLGFKEKPNAFPQSPCGNYYASDLLRAKIQSPATITTALDASPVYLNAIARALKTQLVGERPAAFLLIGPGEADETINAGRLDTMRQIAAALEKNSVTAAARAFVIRPRESSIRAVDRNFPDMSNPSKGTIYLDDGKLAREKDPLENRGQSIASLRKTALGLAPDYSVFAGGYSLDKFELDRIAETVLDGTFHTWLGNIELDENDLRDWLVSKINEGINTPPMDLYPKKGKALSEQEKYDRMSSERQ